MRIEQGIHTYWDIYRLTNRLTTDRPTKAHRQADMQADYGYVSPYFLLLLTLVLPIAEIL